MLAAMTLDDVTETSSCMAVFHDTDTFYKVTLLLYRASYTETRSTMLGPRIEVC